MAQIREELSLVDRFTAQFTKFISLSERASGSADDVRYSLENIETATAATANRIDRLSDEIRNMTDQMGQAQNRGTGLMSMLKQLGGIIGGIGTAKWLIGTSDELTQTTARIDMMNDGLQTTQELTDMIYQSAQRSRGGYQATADMVAKLGTLAGDAFGSSAEVVAFAEQINKQMTLSGTSTMGAQAAMLQLTQAMSSGVLRGEELNSILEQTPTIAQNIAKYLGVTTGEMRQLASEGKVTADVVKNAMFAAAEETNAKFESMPMTWAQVWTSIQNTILVALQPILDGISWLANHFEQLQPILAGLAAGALAYAAALAIQAAAQWIATGAAKAFFATLLSNPLTYIVLAIGLIVAAIYKWVQSMGGLQIAWLIVVDAILYAWDWLKAGFMTGVYFVMDLFDNLNMKIKGVSVSIQNFMGDMRVGVLTILQNMVNKAIDIINWFIDKINKLPGVEIEAIQHQTFATTEALENEAAKSQRNAELAAARQEADARIEDRADKIAQMWNDREANHAARQAEIAQKRAENAAGDDGMSELTGQVGDISQSVGKIEKSVNMSEEDMKSLVDMAERQYVNNINLTAQTPVITINGANTGNTAADRQNLANTIRDILVEQVAAGSVRTTARAF